MAPFHLPTCSHTLPLLISPVVLGLLYKFHTDFRKCALATLTLKDIKVGADTAVTPGSAVNPPGAAISTHDSRLKAPQVRPRLLRSFPMTSELWDGSRGLILSK